MWNMHHYETPSFFSEQFDYWDNWQEVIEHTVFHADTFEETINYALSKPPYHIARPNLPRAIAESVYLFWC
jgi:hypothetical protein